MKPPVDRTARLHHITRRHFFEQASFGIGGLALASLMDRVVLASAQGGAAPAHALQFAPKVSASFTCSWPAHPRRSICSIPSRC
ncbi:MAG: hypothetical protein V7647_1569 [Acidobacteriota bacterium]|jgi:hypothetical protein